jgi:hypothetical protein
VFRFSRHQSIDTNVKTARYYSLECFLVEAMIFLCLWNMVSCRSSLTPKRYRIHFTYSEDTPCLDKPISCIYPLVI